MPVPTDAEQKRISTYKRELSRSAAVATNGDNLPNVVELLDVRAYSETANVNIDVGQKTYVLTVRPNATNIPSPKIGDIAKVFLVDSAQTVNPYRYEEWHYTTTQAVPAAAWHRVSYAA